MDPPPPSTAFPLPPPDELEKLLGPWFWGPVVDIALLGVVVSLTIDYWTRYGGTDSRAYKSLVLLVLLLNVIKSLQTCAELWWKFVVHFGDLYTVLMVYPWFGRLDPITQELCTIVAQLFFCLRLHRMVGGLRWLLIPIGATILMGLAARIMITVQAFTLDTAENLAIFATSMEIGLVGVMAADFTITIATSWYLFRSKTGYLPTDNLIGKLLHLTWITAFLPALSEFCSLVLYLTLSKKNDYLFMGFSYMSPKLYAISMLYTLNVRKALRALDRDMYTMSSQIIGGTGQAKRSSVRVTAFRPIHARGTSFEFATSGGSHTKTSFIPTHGVALDADIAVNLPTTSYHRALESDIV